MAAGNMVVRNNIAALNVHRNMKNVGSMQMKASERLSSGYRINRASDDAAGLAISEKMRGQIRGLTMASKNVDDAISLVKTAEGGMQGIDDMLNRIRELLDFASNDTNEHNELGTGDRQKIQDEVDQLVEEIDSMAGRVEYNKKKLIDGSFADTELQRTNAQATVDKLSVEETAAATMKDALKEATDQAKINLDAAQAGLDQQIKGMPAGATEVAAAQQALLDAQSDPAALAAKATLDTAQTDFNAGQAAYENAKVAFDAADAAQVAAGATLTAAKGAYGTAKNALVNAVNAGRVVLGTTMMPTNASVGAEVNLASLSTLLTATAGDLSSISGGQAAFDSIKAALTDYVTAANALGLDEANAKGALTALVTMGVLASTADINTNMATAAASVTATTYVTVGAYGAYNTAAAAVTAPQATMLANLASMTSLQSDLTAAINGYSTYAANVAAKQEALDALTMGAYNQATKVHETARADYNNAKNNYDLKATAVKDAMTAMKLDSSMKNWTATDITSQSAAKQARLTVALQEYNDAAVAFGVDGLGLKDISTAAESALGLTDKVTVTANNTAASLADAVLKDPDGVPNSLDEIENRFGAVKTWADAEAAFVDDEAKYQSALAVKESSQSAYELVQKDYDNASADLNNVTTRLNAATISLDAAVTLDNAQDSEPLHFQVGANGGQSMFMSIGSIKSDMLGIGDGKGNTSINVLKMTGADITATIDVIDQARSYVATERSRLGAAVNRMEYTQQSLDITNENLSDAESRIRDADMAQEMMNKTKADTLQQVAVAMMSQANQQPQSILQLLG